jgi:hypothetical protein
VILLSSLLGESIDPPRLQLPCDPLPVLLLSFKTKLPAPPTLLILLLFLPAYHFPTPASHSPLNTNPSTTQHYLNFLSSLHIKHHDWT